MEDRTIFLQIISIEEAKKQEYHPSLEIAEIKRKEEWWYYREKILIETEKEKQRMMQWYHRNERIEHPEYKETLRQVTEVAFWDQMRKEILQYIMNCPECQLKREHRKTETGGKVSRPEEVWEKMSIDHITKLPRTKEKDSILVMQDQFSGMIYLKAVTEKENAADTWQDCKKTAWKLHGYPKEIRTDRGFLFASKEWKKYEKELGITHVKTTAYHLQANGQIERANREIKQYLRKYVSQNQEDWSDHLPMLEYVLNTRKATGKTFTFYQIMYRETPIVTAKKEQKDIQFRKKIQKKSGKQGKDYSAPEYKKEDWVYLQCREERKDRPNISLNHKWWSPFEIKRRTGPQNVELHLPRQVKIHPVMNVSIIKLHHGNIFTTPNILHINESITEYKVQYIDNERKRGKEYQIKWKGYDKKIWEPIENLKNAKDVFSLWKKRADSTTTSRNDQWSGKRYEELVTE